MEDDDQDAESEEEEDEEDDDDDGDKNAIKDDFLDMPLDFVGNIRKAKLESAGKKRSETTWSGQEVLLDYDPAYAYDAC
jgi:U3 small nucleolar RNA-associated protein 14